MTSLPRRTSRASPDEADRLVLPGGLVNVEWIETPRGEAIELVAKQDPRTPAKDFGEQLGNLAKERSVA